MTTPHVQVGSGVRLPALDSNWRERNAHTEVFNVESISARGGYVYARRIGTNAIGGPNPRRRFLTLDFLRAFEPVQAQRSEGDGALGRENEKP